MISAFVSNLVSIVTPAYNAARFIEEAVDSVRTQSYENWELLVVDDQSKDATGSLVAAFARRDPRIKLIRAEENGGPARARNLALDVARGRYVAFLDSDDIWLPHKLERQLAFMEQVEASVSYTGYRRISEDGSRLGHQVSVPVKLDYRGLLRNTAILTSSAMVDRAQAGDFRMKSTYYDDFALWLQLLKVGGRACGLNEDLVRYRVVHGSVSRSKLKSARMVWRTYREVEALNLFEALFAFAGYAVNAKLKYSRF